MVKPTVTKLFLTFLKLGASAFGGPAMYVHIRKIIVDKNQWMDARSFDAGLALCQVIPGAIVMQLVAYTGLKIRGLRGALACFIGFGFPAFLIMLLLSILYKHFNDISVIQAILATLRVVIAAIVGHAAFSFGQKTFKNINDILIAVFAGILFLTKLHPALVILCAAFLGLFLSKSEPIVQIETVKARTLRLFLIIIGLIIVTVGLLFIFNKDYFTLATIMLRIDLFSFGGGIASVPVMYHEFIDVHGWFEKKTLLDGIILGQATPGSIIITATFVGYLKYGLMGSIIGTIFVFIPSFLVLMGLVPFFDKLRIYPQFNKVINGILCSFVGLLAVITYHFGLEIHWGLANILIAAVTFGVLLLKIDVPWVILGGILVAVIMM